MFKSINLRCRSATAMYANYELAMKIAFAVGAVIRAYA